MIDGIWDEFLTVVSQEAGSHVVQTWLKAVTLDRWDALDKIVYLKAPNGFVQEWIKGNYLPLFQKHLSRLLNVDSVRIVFVNNDATASASSVEGKSFIPAVPSADYGHAKKEMLVKRMVSRHKGSLNKNYLFTNFVVGPSNELAYAAAHAVCDKLGVLYNPLFIYGPSGLGKTHLLHAVGNEVKAIIPKARILYQTADKFVNEFINAIRYDKVLQFKAKYKEIDVLLIDDIQFISNKEQTQEAFFHIFNMLFEKQKQIIFSSDTDPAGIKGLAERLRSRFQWGLVTDIHMPTTETKIAILKHKADQSGHVLLDEVIHFIASGSMSNIRELEGALIRVTAFASLTNQPVSLELAQKVLNRQQDSAPKAIDFNKIIKVVQQHYAYSLADLRSSGRGKQLSFARQLTMYLMKKLTQKSLQEIGGYLGRKDHSTVIHAVQKIEGTLSGDRVLSRQLEDIEYEITH